MQNRLVHHLYFKENIYSISSQGWKQPPSAHRVKTCGQIKPQAGAQLIKLKVHSCCQSMYDHLRIAGKRALIALAAISAIWVFCISSSGAEFNGTTYHLGEREAVVTLPVSASHLNLTLSYKTQNMTLFDEDGKNVSFNSSYRFWRGEHIYSLTWERNITGKLVYTMPVQGQQFILPLRDERPVAIILPAGYTTGERSLGIARPAPDEFVEDNAGSILIWNNTTQISYIDVTYYRKSAPQALHDHTRHPGPDRPCSDRPVLHQHQKTQGGEDGDGK